MNLSIWKKMKINIIIQEIKMVVWKQPPKIFIHNLIKKDLVIQQQDIFFNQYNIKVINLADLKNLIFKKEQYTDLKFLIKKNHSYLHNKKINYSRITEIHLDYRDLWLKVLEELLISKAYNMIKIGDLETQLKKVIIKLLVNSLTIKNKEIPKSIKVHNL